MFPTQIPIEHTDEYSRCNERKQSPDHGRDLSPIQKTDAAIKENVYHALWNDDVLRAIEYDEIEVHVHNGVVHLNGHIVGTSSRSRIENAIRAIPGTLRIHNNLVLDDKLTFDVAFSLGQLEHTYNCKFFTGASHGVVSLNGTVSAENVKLLAERQVSGNPKVRGVINHVRIKGSGPGEQIPPFLQPAIGETIYFLDGISGIVKQVIINANNRLVIAMTVQWKITDHQWHESISLTQGNTRFPEQQVIVPMSAVRYLTRDSGFLSIKSSERNRYLDFDSTSFSPPGLDWVPPYPYCSNDVLFPIKQQVMANHVLRRASLSPFAAVSKEKLFREQLPANDSLGG